MGGNKSEQSSDKRKSRFKHLNYKKCKIKIELDEAAESCTKDGESPVVESSILLSFLIPSSMGHVKSRVNLRGPPRKAQYFWVTDSEIVPRGKGEREPL